MNYHVHLITPPEIPLIEENSPTKSGTWMNANYTLNFLKIIRSCSPWSMTEDLKRFLRGCLKKKSLKELLNNVDLTIKNRQRNTKTMWMKSSKPTMIRSRDNKKKVRKREKLKKKKRSLWTKKEISKKRWKSLKLKKKKMTPFKSQIMGIMAQILLKC